LDSLVLLVFRLCSVVIVVIVIVVFDMCVVLTHGSSQCLLPSLALMSR
jgi:hypothetical protein